MVRPLILKRWAAILLVASMVGFAPLFHALCIAPMTDSHGSAMSHVMADGMTFEIPPTVVEGTAHAAADISLEIAQIAQVPIGWAKSISDPASPSQRAITIFPLLAYLLFLVLAIIRRPKVYLVDDQSPKLFTPQTCYLRRSAAVDLISLGISRT